MGSSFCSPFLFWNAGDRIGVLVDKDKSRCVEMEICIRRLMIKLSASSNIPKNVVGLLKVLMENFCKAYIKTGLRTCQMQLMSQADIDKGSSHISDLNNRVEMLRELEPAGVVVVVAVVEEETNRIIRTIKTESEEIQVSNCAGGKGAGPEKDLNGSGIGRADNQIGLAESHQFNDKAMRIKLRTHLGASKWLFLNENGENKWDLKPMVLIDRN
ncbi:hypothetical protein BY996DRAFT_6563336 [Phakopsora pachyrhizi]|nr:hypothetical protein BY996DRAFT_6563336 [Phakopsora pachyrhizi]